MINKMFEKNLLNLVFDNTLSNKKLLEASEIYLNSNIDIIEKESDAILFDIDGTKINVVYRNNRVFVYKDDMINYLDEYTVACLMHYKRELYIKDEVILKQEDLQINQYYYNNYFITKTSYELYQARFNFYFGIIDKLYDLGIIDYCIKVMVELFGTLDTKFSYESKYLDKEKYNLFRIIKDKFNVLYDYPYEIINNFNYKNYPITTLGKLIYVACVNKATILRNSNIKIIYEHVFDNYLKFLKTTQLYKDLIRQYNIIKWYNKEIDDSFIENNLDYYDVVCVYINELYEKEEYKKICNIFKENKISKVTNDLMYKIIGSFYKCSLYSESINLFKLMKNITFDTYMDYKKDYPLLFSEDYIENIVENIIENGNDEEILKILEVEKIEGFKLLVIAKKDFNLINDKFYEYKGKYDNQLIKIYQKELYNNLLTIRGYYARTPFDIISKLDKLNELKNGKYYIKELIHVIKHKAFLSFYDELLEYCEGLGI